MNRHLVPIIIALAAAPSLAHAQSAPPVARPVPLYELPPPPPPPPPAPIDPGQVLLDEDAPPLPDLPPPPNPSSAPPPDTMVVDKPVFTKPPPVPSMRRIGFHLGTNFGVEVARAGESSYALGGGAQMGFEIYWPWIGIELAAAISAHGDTGSMPDYGYWEAHPMVYLKKPFKSGVWEVFAGYGVSPAALHEGDFARGQHVHVVEAGFEDRTSNWYSRLFVRWYAPFDGDLVGAPTTILGASVGLFHLSKQKK
jgi:hypothetical protein